MTNLASKNIPKQPVDSELKTHNAEFLANHLAAAAPIFIHPTPFQSLKPSRVRDPDSQSCYSSCPTCPALELLCGEATNNGEAGSEEYPVTLPLFSTVHKIPARRLILHPKEWSEFVPIICNGWAMSSVALPDGRRQIISFLLPGDVVSAGSLLAPLSGHTVEAITEVTYRKFKRDEIKALLFGNSDLLERLFGLWNEAKIRADQLALDLGRRRADERIARLILRLADKIAKRNIERGQTIEFPLRQRHIADATGLTPVHVSKVLGELQRAGLLEISSRSLTIINEAELQRLADWR